MQYLNSDNHDFHYALPESKLESLFSHSMGRIACVYDPVYWVQEEVRC